MTRFVVRYRWIVVLLAVILAGGCSPDTGQSPPVTPETSAQTCPSLVQTAMSALDANCSATSRNQVCYGNTRLSAVPQSGASDFQFNAPGDIVDLNNLKTLQLSSMNTDSGEWGVALMRVQGDIPDSLPGQNLTVLLFGNVEIEAAPPSDDATVVNSFYFRTGLGDSPCVEAPESGILVQTPDGVRTVKLRMNEVDIELGSTAYFQAPENADMAVNVVEGQAAVTAQGVTRRVSAGTRTQIPLDANRRPAGPPSVPQVYEAARLQSLPLASLQRQIDIANQLLAATFTDTAEEWTVSPGAGNLQQSPADDTADGYICAQSPAGGEPWYFVSPPAWRGDYAAAYGGALYTILRAESSPAETPDVRLTGGGLTLANRLPYPVETTWTGYRLALTTSAGWTDTSTNQPATAEQIRAVLGALETISIPGGQGRSCLDSVHLTSAVQPLVVRPTPVVRQPTATPYVEVAGRVPIDLTVSDSLDQPGQQKTYTFEAAPGQTVYFDAQDGSFYMRWAVTDSTGTAIFDGGRMVTDAGIFTLERGGSYTVTVFGDEDTVGPYQFKVWDVPPPQNFTFAIGDTVTQDQPGAGAGNIESPGSQDIYTFQATAGRQVTFDAQDGSFYIRWAVTDSAGTVIAENGRMTDDPLTLTLEQGGAYTVRVYGDEDTVGTYRFRITEQK
ncbi:MAG: hypothetical protein H6671_15230 [Anaerolineaceae bacterium]|nr:hypothetical protein [Anaerolineaceae bacterium]